MLANLNKMFKRLDVTYNKEELLSLANSLEYNRAYKELGRAIPQEIVPAFGLAHPLIKHITQQLPKVRFYLILQGLLHLDATCLTAMKIKLMITG